MSLKEQMFLEVSLWLDSGESKSRFLEGKSYSEAKFNYWLLKWKLNEQLAEGNVFREVNFSEVKLGKVLEIEAPSGVKITVFA